MPPRPLAPSPARSRRRGPATGGARRRLVACACALALGGCALSERPRRAPPRESAEPDGPPDASSAEDPQQPGGTRQIPREANPAIAQSEPVDVGAAQCPGVRLLRVDRHWVVPDGAAPSPPPAGAGTASSSSSSGATTGAPLPPRYYGRDDVGRVWSLRDVLECELSRMHFVAKAFPEGVNLVLWRGPFIFEPDNECDWRDPVRVENIAGGRRLHIHERCRRRARGEPAARIVVVDVLGDEARVVMR